MTVVASLSSADSEERCVVGEWVKAAASLPWAASGLVHRLAGTGALHHLLGLLLSHAALGY